jgi:Cu-Zn family superoxide dismutase
MTSPATLLLPALAFATLAFAADPPMPTATGPAVTDAIAVLSPLQGSTVGGTVRFRKAGNAVHVTGEVTGLVPGSKVGFHIHEFGDCSAPDGSSAGGHFAPEGNPHGAPTAPQHHAGDLGNLEADDSGTAKVEVTAPKLGIATGPEAIVGRGLIVHVQTDDFTTQPTGNAGGRAACGVIGVAKPAS